MTLDRNAAQHKVDLIVIVAESSQILDDSQAGLAVRYCRVHVVLLAVLVDREAFLWHGQHKSESRVGEPTKYSILPGLN